METETEISAPEAWDDLLDGMVWLEPQTVVWALGCLLAVYTDEELNRAYLHRQRKIDRAQAAIRVRSEGGAW